MYNYLKVVCQKIFCLYTFGDFCSLQYVLLFISHEFTDFIYIEDMKTLYYILRIFWGRARSKMLGAPLNKGLAGNRIHQLKLVLIPKMLNGWKPWRITGQWNPRARLPGPHLQRTLWLLGQHLAELVVAHGVLPKSEWKGYVYWGRGLYSRNPSKRLEDWLFSFANHPKVGRFLLLEELKPVTPSDKPAYFNQAQSPHQGDKIET